MVMRLFNVHLSYKKRESESWVILSPGVVLIRTRIRTHSLRRQTSSPTCTSINVKKYDHICSITSGWKACNMSFPPEPLIIQPEEILESDIIIEDCKLVALGGNELATQASNTAAKSSYYSKLIESLAGSIRSKEKSDESEWNLGIYKLATEKIINLVTKTKSPTQRRFVWFRQFPDAHYVVMTRIQTINKLANDLDCQMRKLKAREVSEAHEANRKQQKPNQRRYAQSLILKVCRAVRKGISPYQAVQLLDFPIVKVQESLQNASDETNTEKRVEAAEGTNQESDLGRQLRLQLRHRFLACIRSKQCIFDMANAMLTMWGLPNISKIAPKLKKRKKIDTTGSTTAAKPKRKKVEYVPHTLGPWNRDERMAFLKGLETHGAPHWVKIAPFISTRYVFVFYRILEYIFKIDV